MRTLLHWTWGFFAADALLAFLLIFGGIFDKGDAAGRRLAMVYAVFVGILLAVLAIIVAVNSYLPTTIGLGLTLTLEIVPWAFLVYEATKRILARIT